MASEKGPVATEAPLAAAPAPLPTALQPPVSPDTFAPDGRSPSLKRPRDASPSSTAGLSRPDVVPVKYARLVDSTKYSAAPPLTAQAALEDEQHRREEEARLHPPDAVSDNPAQQALAALRGAEAAMSRATEEDLQAAQAAQAAAAKALNPVIIPPQVDGNGNHAGASPHSATSGQSLGSGPHVVHSPVAMDVDARGERQGYLQPDAQMEEKPLSMSYPGILPPGGVMPAPATPQRGMSLPMSSSQNPDLAPRSPSSKKHKCPYCETEFTRHHNLKSHLLTHSQEKPYVCQDCQMRFRRLHDLKRHSKLHTGEKPHICPKCDRKFARGDALARHSKGAGGCAGRRASMGSFAGDDDYEGASTTEADDSAMAGVVYDNAEADMTDEERRRLSLPAIKAPSATAAQGGAEGYTPLSRSYPPPAGARSGTTGAAAQPSAASAVPAIAPQPAGQPATHPQTPAASAPNHAQGGVSGDSSANMFASGEGMWTYIQSLEARLQSTDDMVRQQNEQLRHQTEQIGALEARSQHLEIQVGRLTEELDALRGQAAPTTQPEDQHN